MKKLHNLKSELEMYLSIREFNPNYKSYKTFLRSARHRSYKMFKISLNDDKEKIYHQLRERKIYMNKARSEYRRFAFFTYAYDIITSLIFCIMMILFVIFGLLII